MKNLKGEELPFRNLREKRDWYAEAYEVAIPITIIDKEEGAVYEGIYGKDDVFFNVLLPTIASRGVTTVLDVGAAQGRYTAFFHQLGYQVTGSEIVEERTDILRESLNSHGFETVPAITQDIEEVDIDDIGTWDLIFLSDIVEHFMDWELTIEKIALRCKYCYMLIPGEDSWSFSPDHLHRFGIHEITNLMSKFDNLEFALKKRYNKNNYYWYSLLMKGFVL